MSQPNLFVILNCLQLSLNTSKIIKKRERRVEEERKKKEIEGGQQKQPKRRLNKRLLSVQSAQSSVLGQCLDSAHRPVIDQARRSSPHLCMDARACGTGQSNPRARTFKCVAQQQWSIMDHNKAWSTDGFIWSIGKMHVFITFYTCMCTIQLPSVITEHDWIATSAFQP